MKTPDEPSVIRKRSMEEANGAFTDREAAQNSSASTALRYRNALESIADWRNVNISGEYEHGLRDIIRSIVDSAVDALDSPTQRPAPQEVPLPTPANLWRDAAVFPVPLSHSTEAPQVPEVSAGSRYADLTRELHSAADQYDRGHGPLHAAAANAIQHLETLLQSSGPTRHPPVPIAWFCEGDPDIATAFSWKAGSCQSCDKVRIPVYALTSNEPQSVVWQPIETAPKDKPIMLCVEGFLPSVGRWWPVDSCWASFDWEGHFESDKEMSDHVNGSRYEPTHWSPLPAGPSVSRPYLARGE